MLVAEAMTTHPITLPPGAPAKRAAAAMRDNGIGDVLVVKRGGQLLGIVTDRDIAVRSVGEGRRMTTKLEEICTQEPVTITANEGLEQAVETMKQNKVRRVPVVDNDGKAIGVVSLGDAATRLDEDSALADISRAPANN